jgi:hypothetical protein
VSDRVPPPLVVIYRVQVPGLGRDAPPVYRDEAIVEMERQGIPYINLCPSFLDAFQSHRPSVRFHKCVKVMDGAG